MDIGVEMGIIEKGGSWFSYGGTRLGQGRDNALAFLESNAEMFAEVEEKIRVKFAEMADGSVADVDEDDLDGDEDDFDLDV
jgi:recombination protein RecA